MAELDSAGARLEFELDEESDRGPVLTLAGELDITTAGQLEAAVAPVVARSPNRITVDVRGLEFADSSAIALLVRWANMVPEVELRHPSEQLTRVLSRMGLTRRLKVTR